MVGSSVTIHASINIRFGVRARDGRGGDLDLKAGGKSLHVGQCFGELGRSIKQKQKIINKTGTWRGFKGLLNAFGLAGSVLAWQGLYWLGRFTYISADLCTC